MNRPRRLWIPGVILSSLAFGCSKVSVSTTEFGESKEISDSHGAKRTLFVGGKEQPRDTTTTTTAPVAVSPKRARPVALNEVGFGSVELAIDAARGKVVLVDCWATWCPPCVASFPKLVEKHEQFAKKGLAVISVSLDEPGEGEKVMAFLQKQNATFTNFLLKVDEAAQMGLQQKFAFTGGIPHAVLFNKFGDRVWSGHPLDPKLQAKLESELGR